jgi:hypothetical protein
MDGGGLITGEAQEEVCDLGVDFCLGVEDSMDAIRLHGEIVARTRSDRSKIVVALRNLGYN